MQEIWKPIIGFENLYEVSNLGNVRSLERIVIDKIGRKLVFHSVVLVPRKTNKEYLTVKLSKNGKFKNYSVHRLVAEAFIQNDENKPCIDHINGNRQDNSVSNLRWVTPKENQNNPITRENMKNSIRKLNTKCSKPIEAFNNEGEVIYTFPSLMEAHRNGYDYRLVSACCLGKRFTHKGLHWRFLSNA